MATKYCHLCPVDSWHALCHRADHKSMAQLCMGNLDSFVRDVERSLATWTTATGDAAHDCYQLALQALEPVRAAIDRARKAREGEGE